ncbi:hypothetical protein PC112_g21871 [Phytophthora cactorum]|nr:hypothetical protein PC112_g21871 [Phytophthora cactorum]
MGGYGFVQSHHLDLAGAATRQFARCGIFCTPVIGLSPPSPASPFNTTMARTPKTAMIKAQMAEQTRLEEEARRQEEARRPDASTARTRSTELGRAAGSSSRDRDDVDVGEDKVEEGEKSCDADDAVSEEKDEGGSEDKDDGDSEDQHPRTSGKGKARRGRKRLAAELEEGEALCHVPPFKPDHDTWANLETCLKDYMMLTHQKLVIKEVVHVVRRNADLRTQVRYQGVPDSEIPLIPSELDPYQRKFICTHDACTSH